MKRTGKKRKGSRRGRNKKSVLGAIDFTSILGVIAGASVAGYADKLVPETVDRKIVAGGKILLGVVLPMLGKSGAMKNALQGVGNGMIAIGTVDLLKGFGVLGATADELEVDLSDLSGVNDQENVLAGDDEDISVLNGDDEDISVLNGDDDISVINGDFDEDEY
jgi:hypothetical protein